MQLWDEPCVAQRPIWWGVQRQEVAERGEPARMSSMPRAVADDLDLGHLGLTNLGEHRVELGVPLQAIPRRASDLRRAAHRPPG